MTEAILVILLIAAVLYMGTEANKVSEIHGRTIRELQDKLYKCEARLLMYEREED